ncbi:3-dehydroquinate dehydratase [Branchiibius hedensis]|uniref:3-dehydroquinate dehydratase n=2 Tax=Branchiibius hedensis TaxID=672460 RepID=A0A2Y9BUR1_9MICO|nr:3-dehydroquinate dehydratase [Branchiibius hedensis]SSA36142.1 3-dehydroquinate dehydratase [Branchiibius hedensis]
MRAHYPEAMSIDVLVLNGPNLNLLGTREPGIYGSDTLASIEQQTQQVATTLGVTTTWEQSNHEGTLVDLIHDARGKFKGIVINAGAYTHTSVAIRDALKGVGIPFVEVHISNVHAREEFRAHSYLSDIADAIIVGAGPLGYELAIRTLAPRLVDPPKLA